MVLIHIKIQLAIHSILHIVDNKNDNHQHKKKRLVHDEKWYPENERGRAVTLEETRPAFKKKNQEIDPVKDDFLFTDVS
jgi:ribosomal protein S17